MRILPVTLTILALIACKGDKPKLVIDEAVVAERMEHIEANIPSCHEADSGSSAMARTGPMLQDATRTIGDMVELIRLVGHEPTMKAGVSTVGTCGGSLDVSFLHESGTTDYEAILADYCVTGPEGDSVYNGTVVAKEVGKSSDDGPVIESLEMSTVGAVVVTQGAQTLEITVDKVETEYGIPQAWEPAFPSADDPDRTTIGAIRVVYPTTGREDFVEDLEIERSTGLPATVTILSGRSGTVGDDVATLRTAEGEPLILDVYNGSFQGGTLEIVGAKDTLVTVTPRPGAPGMYDVTLDGVAVDQSIDCSNGEAPRSVAVQALLQALPVY